MTAITTTPADHVEARPTTKAPRSAALRRGFFVASPVLAGILLVIATAADPAAGINGQEMNQAYTDNPGPLQWHSLTLHWSYAFWGITAFMAAAYVKGRGATLANIGAFLAFIGMTTLPGLVAIDWYDSSDRPGLRCGRRRRAARAHGQDPVGAAVLRHSGHHRHPALPAGCGRSTVARWGRALVVLRGRPPRHRHLHGQRRHALGSLAHRGLFTVLGVDLARGTRAPRA